MQLANLQKAGPRIGAAIAKWAPKDSAAALTARARAGLLEAMRFTPRFGSAG